MNRHINAIVNEDTTQMVWSSYTIRTEDRPIAEFIMHDMVDSLGGPGEFTDHHVDRLMKLLEARVVGD